MRESESREKERESVCVCVRERVHVCVCVRVGGKRSRREGECVRFAFAERGTLRV